MEILLEPSVLPVGDFGRPRAKFLQRWSLWYAAINDSCARLSRGPAIFGDHVYGRWRSYAVWSMVRPHNAQRIRLYEFQHIIPHGLTRRGIIEVVFIACSTYLLVATAWSQSRVRYERSCCWRLSLSGRCVDLRVVPKFQCTTGD